MVYCKSKKISSLYYCSVRIYHHRIALACWNTQKAVLAYLISNPVCHSVIDGSLLVFSAGNVFLHVG